MEEVVDEEGTVTAGAEERVEGLLGGFLAGLFGLSWVGLEWKRGNGGGEGWWRVG